MQDFQPFINHAIYFNSSVEEQEKREVRELILETCNRIERKDVGEIIQVLADIEFIVYKPIEGDHAMDVDRSPDGGVLMKSCSRLFIIYYPNPKRFIQRETKLYILAHEFAHVFHKHPYMNSTPNPQEKEQFEREADKKAVEWGFRPHDDEVDLFRTYKTNLSLGLLGS